MCGRFTSTTSAADLADWFDVAEVLADELPPDHNVTPSRIVYIVREEGDERLLDSARWGLVPSWADDPGIGSRLINARSETAAQKPSFRSAFRRRRCLMPVDGFYEWSVVPGQRRKQPWYFTARDHGPLAFAGLWESWRSPTEPDASPLHTCTILTGQPNGVVSPIHDRMPMILGQHDWDAWLDPTNEDVEVLTAMLGPAPEDLLTVWPVSLAVNDVHRHDDGLVIPVDPPASEVQGSLF